MVYILTLTTILRAQYSTHATQHARNGMTTNIAARGRTTHQANASPHTTPYKPKKSALTHTVTRTMTRRVHSHCPRVGALKWYFVHLEGAATSSKPSAIRFVRSLGLAVLHRK